MSYLSELIPNIFNSLSFDPAQSDLSQAGSEELVGATNYSPENSNLNNDELLNQNSTPSYEFENENASHKSDTDIINLIHAHNAVSVAISEQRAVVSSEKTDNSALAQTDDTDLGQGVDLSELTTDNTLQPFSNEPALLATSLPNSPQAQAGANVPSVSSSLDLSQTFFLNSLVGANHTIYLDFTGHVTSGTFWNTDFNQGADIVTTAFDLDGNTASFSNAELERIQYIWQRVAEDFSPFNVNVTTQAPSNINDLIKNNGNGDNRWGVRVVIGGSSYDWYGVNAGGVAYDGSFNWNSDTPVFVFEQQLSNGDEKNVADTITHEVGHSLGLDHDGQKPSTEYYLGQGSGETGWAPIMGSGQDQNLVQWSKGEYANASNTQDDLAIITTQNGFGYRADDAGNTIATAKSLTVSNLSFNASGIIEQNTDVDFYSFSATAGVITLTVNPFERGPNLDILAQLYNSAGTLIASSNPTDQLSAQITTNVAAGTYYLKVDGVGKGDPLTTGYTDYGSLGQYNINGTLNNPEMTISSPATVIEGLDANATFTVTLSAARPYAVSVDYATANQTASAIVDYTTTQGTLTFDAGETSKTITVPIINNNSGEADETFVLNLSNVTNATLNKNQVVTTISDTLTRDVTTALISQFASVENLTLTGIANIDGTGNANINKIIGNSGNNKINGAAGADVLTGGAGADTFIFQFKESTVSSTDAITDFAIGIDKIDVVGLSNSLSLPVQFTRAANSTATNKTALATEVFKDANGATSGSQALAANSAALVQVSSGSMAGTYIFINDGTAGYQSANDMLINITGFTGTLPSFGAITVSSFFV